VQPTDTRESSARIKAANLGIDDGMTVRRLVLLAGAVLLIAGIIALLVPVTVSGNGESIGCGNAIAADTSAAKAADDRSGGNIPVVSEFIPHSNYVSQCESSVSTRRAWSIPLAVIGLVALAGGALVQGRSGARAA
jgi:hypothetical protein